MLRVQTTSESVACPPAGPVRTSSMVILAVAVVTSLAAMPVAAQTSEANRCTLATPLWLGGDVVQTVPGRAWWNGRRSDGDCDSSLAGWMRTSWASAFASSRPDGLAAPAAGATVSLSGGALLRRGPLEVRIMPEVAWHQNADVDIPGSVFEDARQYGYWAPIIDLPLRFGPDPFTLIGPGRSGVRLHVAGLSAGLDAEPVRWGPSRRYPLLLSGQQTSLPRIGIRTEEPFDLGGFGTIDFNVLYARLTTSEWFGAAEARDRLLAGFTLAWAPGPLPGLAVGISSLHHQYLDDVEFGSVIDYLQSPAQDPADNSSGNGLGNVWVAWSSPEVGLEVWAEWMKDDYNRSLTQLLLEPEKGTGRTIGVRQAVDYRGGRLSLHLESSSTRNRRPLTTDPDGARGILYTNGTVIEGHTDRGQLLGTFIGPGGDGQFLEVAYRSDALTAVQLERLRFNTDTYTERLGAPLGDAGYDVELVGRLLHERPIGSLQARGEVEFGARRNRLFLQDDPSWDGNVRLGLMLRWRR